MTNSVNSPYFGDAKKLDKATPKKVRHQVTLDPIQVEFLRELGKGNLSAGVAQAIKILNALDREMNIRASLAPLPENADEAV